jgi:hypothetical protein
MQQAYKNLGYNPNMATVTNLYVRFKPTTAQLAALDSIMDAQGLDLFDTPMDYDVTYEGDYYQDPSIPDSLPTWQYAVVLPNFVFPAGIIHETLAQIHIPTDAYTAIETEAENIAGGGGGALNTTVLTNGNVHPNTPQCPPGYHYDFSTHTCTTCPSGYTWDGTACVPPSPPPTCSAGYYYNGSTCVPYNTTPPAAAPDAAIPAGGIRVFDTQLSPSNTFPDGLPVRKARMVARRWFKIERTYTDDYGNFTFTKHFKHKVRVLVKFKNDDAQVRNIRRAAFWQMLFPVKYSLGIFSGDKSNIAKVFTQFSNYSAKGNIYWTAATVHNAVQEYRGFAATEGIGQPTQGLKIFISKSGLIGNGGATPMFAKRFINNISTAFATTFLSSLVAAVVAVVKNSQLDMIIGYRYSTNNIPDITQLLSDRIKETTYHELTHSAHYSALGNTWYTQFVTAEEYEGVANLSNSFNPYGDGTNTTYSPIIALGESWAYHMGHYLADKRYLNQSSNLYDGGQATYYYNGAPTAMLSSHLNLLENFNPHRNTDPFHWIPTGLFYDMIDTRNDFSFDPTAVDDQVSGYTNQQFFNAFSSSITTLGSYKSNLLLQNSNNQSIQVTSIFSQYGY